MKKARQARSRETQKKIIAAAEELLKETGSGQFKIENLTTRAGCSTGSFYNLFADRKALVIAVMRSIADRTLDNIQKIFSDPKLEQADLQTIVQVMVSFSKEVYHENGPIFRISQTLSMDEPELLCVSQEIVDTTVATIGKLRPMAKLTEAELQFLIRMIIATFDHYLFFADGQALKSDDINRHLEKVLVRYINSAD